MGDLRRFAGGIARELLEQRRRVLRSLGVVCPDLISIQNFLAMKFTAPHDLD
jgi:hypothetical protein